MRKATKVEQRVMKDSRLVQRLGKPHGGVLGFTDNPFSFGGGLRNGGLSDEAMGLLRGVFSFDYMGAAEFEFGAVPEALSRIANNVDRFVAFSFTIPLARVERYWREASDTVPDGEASVYVLCDERDADEAKKRIRAWAAGKGQRLKEPSNLSTALRPVEEWHGDTCGWLELDNGWFFFTDETMWKATADLFGIEVEA